MCKEKFPLFSIVYFESRLESLYCTRKILCTQEHTWFSTLAVQLAINKGPIVLLYKGFIVLIYCSQPRISAQSYLGDIARWQGSKSKNLLQDKTRCGKLKDLITVFGRCLCNTGVLSAEKEMRRGKTGKKAQKAKTLCLNLPLYLVNCDLILSTWL